ncbi:MAG: type 4a pilus biogenesis protein PilO [bacterium]
MKKNALFSITLLLVMSLISSYYYIFLHLPGKRNLTAIKKRIKTLDYDLIQYENNLAHLKNKISKLPLEYIKLNYFNRQDLKEEDQATFFLQLINNLANSLGLTLLEISPGKSENKNNYIKTSCEVMLQGDYFKLLLFIWRIENDTMLNIDTLVISNSDYKYNTLSHINALLNINSIDMTKSTETNLKTLNELREQYISLANISLTTEERRRLEPGEVYRNPFLEPSEAKYAREMQLKLEESLKGLPLTGIMDFKGKKRVLIDNQLFKEGDLLFNQIKILKIKETAVILGINDNEYTLNIKKNPVSVRQNGRRSLYE